MNWKKDRRKNKTKRKYSGKSKHSEETNIHQKI